MYRGNGTNTQIPIFVDENGFQYPASAPNQLPLFGSFPLGSNADPVNYFVNEHPTPPIRHSKRGREVEGVSRQQKLQISLNHNLVHDDTGQAANLPAQNPVSTGLKLSYDDDEPNSSVSSASGSMNASASVIMSLGDNIKTEMERQKKEFDQYLKTQEETWARGVRDIKQRHMASLLTAVEKNVGTKLQEKDIELENINRKNRELVERMKLVTAEAQNWCYRAKCNESLVITLRTNLQQAMQSAEQGKEGTGDNELDDAVSCIDPNNWLSIPSGSGKCTSTKKAIICKVCKLKEVSILLMPCRHLCLCKDCEGLVNVCPICQLMTTASVEVLLS
ncbi:E3 ubiquitin-protein ligase BOI [Lycium barbarum]|uniref:E3 ubiquitin-protein ligase BOI n=1 Tax=Lycium barbarum TaxID=112863 RepID=UPI00293E438F|nr:E3 ubiquitin-protein ligase BOI [Lycium barbarum]XP_060213966.1 E3 ubiquitin-protein ligase BOI [Lycium barbarum]XP_060213967.1 E3 ubiquitin-protein ligase BOI [Lycium barbarum]